MKPLLALPALAAVLAACGGADEPPTPQAQVRATLRDFATAVQQRQYATLCDEIFAPGLLQGLQEIGLPCEAALRQSLGEVREPKLTVGTVTVRGTTARAEVETAAAGQAPSTDMVQLTRVNGRWRISALGGGAQAPATPSPSAAP